MDGFSPVNQVSSRNQNLFLDGSASRRPSLTGKTDLSETTSTPSTSCAGKEDIVSSAIIICAPLRREWLAIFKDRATYRRPLASRGHHINRRDTFVTRRFRWKRTSYPDFIVSSEPLPFDLPGRWFLEGIHPAWILTSEPSFVAKTEHLFRERHTSRRPSLTGSIDII